MATKEMHIFLYITERWTYMQKNKKINCCISDIKRILGTKPQFCIFDYARLWGGGRTVVLFYPLHLHTGSNNIEDNFTLLLLYYVSSVSSQPKSVWSWDTVWEMDHPIHLLHSSLFSWHQLLAAVKQGTGLSELGTKPTTSALINTHW